MSVCQSANLFVSHLVSQSVIESVSRIIFQLFILPVSQLAKSTKPLPTEKTKTNKNYIF